MEKELILALDCNQKTVGELLKLSQEAIERKDFELAEKIHNIIEENLTDIQPVIDTIAHVVAKVGDTK